MYDFDNLDHYQLLGVPRSASPDEIKKAYRREIAQYHPDRFHGATESELAYARARSQRITEAYKELSDFAARTRYNTQDSPTATAQIGGLYAQALALLDAGKPREALPLLQRIQQLDPFYRDSAALLARAEAESKAGAAAAGGAVPPNQNRRRTAIYAGGAAGAVGVALLFWFLGGRPDGGDPQEPTQVVVAPRLTETIIPTPVVETTNVAEGTLVVPPTEESPPTAEPTDEPTAEPTPTDEPTIEPTLEPTAEPTLEPTAEPTLEPTAVPLPPTIAPPTAIPPTAVAGGPLDFLSGPLIATDEFENAGTWITGATPNWLIEFAGGRYHMSMVAGVGSLWSYNTAPIPIDGSAISIDMAVVQGSGGILFGFIDGSNYYRYITGVDGSWRLEWRSGGTFTLLAQGTGAGTGRLSVAVQGARAYLYHNLYLIAVVDLPTVPTGTYGLIVTAPGAAEAYFDSLSIRQIP